MHTYMHTCIHTCIHECIHECIICCLQAISNFFHRSVGKLAKAAQGSDNDAELELDAGELDEARLATLAGMSKKPSTKLFVSSWQHVKIRVFDQINVALVLFFGDAAGQHEWHALQTSAASILQPIYPKYAVLTCVQACLRKLKSGESRQSVVSSARVAASSLAPDLPLKLVVMMQSLCSAAGVPAVDTAAEAAAPIAES